MTDVMNSDDALAELETLERSGFEDLCRVLEADRSDRLGVLAPLVGAVERLIAAILRRPDWPVRR